MSKNDEELNPGSNKQSKKRKPGRKKIIELITAILLTVALTIAIPVYAWFSNQHEMAKLAKIKAPDDLYINAAHKEDKIHLDMRDINIKQKYTPDGGTETAITAQNFPFTVSGNYVNWFTLQIEHTANNPYTYSVYEGTVYKVYKNADGTITQINNGSGTYVDKILNIKTGKRIDEENPNYKNRNGTDHSLGYVEYIATADYDAEEVLKVSFPTESVSVSKGDTLYVVIGSELTNIDGNTGSYLNKDSASRIKADSTLTQKSYDDYNNFNIYADPLYWQLKKVRGGTSKGNAFYNTYVLKVSWTGVNNISQYAKETDMVYISAFVE